MSRPPNQKASVRKENGVWVGCRYRDAAGVRKAAPRFPQAKTKTEALALMTEILVPVNAEKRAAASGPAMPIGAFVEKVYLPFKRREWKRSTDLTTTQRLKQHVITGEFGKTPIKALTREVLQQFLDTKQLLSHSIVNHLRWDLRAICRLAQEDGLLPRDQSGSIFTPETAETAEKRIMTREEIVLLMASLPLRERLFCRFALFAGMRPGEIIALRWDSFEAAIARIDQRVYRGTSDRPKGKKGRNTSRVAALSSGLLADLARWRDLSKRTESSYVFASSNLKTPEQYSRILEKRLHPALKPVGLGWVNFQVMRRTWSSLSKAAGADQQAVADQLGHTVKVDLADYSQSPMEDRLAAVEMFERYVQ
jgi:integrase